MRELLHYADFIGIFVFTQFDKEISEKHDQVEKQFRGGGRAKWWQSSNYRVPLMLAVQPDRTVYARVRAVTKHIVTTGDGQMSTKGQLRNI